MRKKLFTKLITLFTEKSRSALACSDRMPQAHFRYFQMCATSHVITKRGVCGGVRVRSHAIHDQACIVIVSVSTQFNLICSTVYF